MAENFSEKSLFFAKANALGNDFVLIKTDEILNENRVKLIANPKLGVGADQILTLDSENFVRIWNADGSTAKMCGNGLRALGLWIFQNSENPNENPNFAQFSGVKILSLETPAGIVQLEKFSEEIALKMPKMAEITEFPDHFEANIGNLHKIFVLEKNPENFESYARSDFNVSCIWFENGLCRARTYEIGAQETLACGSAAFSIACVLLKIGKSNLDVNFRLGTIKHRLNGREIVQIGQAEIIAQGQLYI